METGKGKEREREKRVEGDGGRKKERGRGGEKRKKKKNKKEINDPWRYATTRREIGNAANTFSSPLPTTGSPEFINPNY